MNQKADLMMQRSNNPDAPIKIYILCDMEGICGIYRPEQVDGHSPAYQKARTLLTADVNTAVLGAFAGGATQIVVCDTHGGGGHLLRENLDSRVKYETPTAQSPMPSLDRSFSGLILLGQHARAGTLRAFLDHTISSLSWFRCDVNGKEIGEIALQAAYAGHFGVPIIMVTGDEAACLEAKALLPGILATPVKTALERNRAQLLPVGKCRRQIRQDAAAAVAKAASLKPWSPALPITFEVTFYRSDYADRVASKYELIRVDARKVRKIVPTAKDIFPLPM